MEEKDFPALIQSLEALAEKNAALYRFRVFMLALLGYLYLLLIVVILLAIVALVLYYGRLNYLTIKVIWIPFVVAGLVLRALWITPEVPDGAELQREQAPALFDLVHEVTVALNGPKVHHILVSGDFNAGVVQIPMFGMFGWLTNYLVVGLPLLQSLDAAQFRAVLAHEVGHLSAKHSGGFTAWIYRVRLSWAEILTRVRAERHYASFLFEPFLNWYAPYLMAYSFVLARARERQADRYSVELAGKETAASALARIATKDRSLSEDFWPNFFRGAKEQARAPRDPFAQMLVGLEQPIGPVNAQRWFYEALQVPTDYTDTHPALGDRLAAMGYAKESSETAAVLDALLAAEQKKETAAAYYLRELPEDFLDRSNRLLRERLTQVWSESHAQSNEAKKQLDKLEAQAAGRALTIEEQWQRVMLVAQVHDRKAAVPLIENILSEEPAHVGANYAMGEVLLEQRNPAGIQYLEKAMELSPEVTGAASVLLSGFYFLQGNRELAETYRLRAAEHYEKQQKQQQLAVNFSPKDTLLPHELSEAVVGDIQAQLSKVRGLMQAFLVRKVVEGLPPFYVLAIRADFTWRNGVNDLHLDAIFGELSHLSVLPEPMVFVSLDGVNSFLEGMVQRIPGAAIFVQES